MNKRIKKKLVKKMMLHSDALATQELVYCTVLASEECLKEIGIDKPLTDKKVIFIRDYPTGYSKVKVRYDEGSDILGRDLFNFYDIPKNWLDFK